MSENNKNFENEHNSLQDVAEFQNNQFNPGYYVGTGKVPPSVYAAGNPVALVVLCLFAAVIIFAFGLFLFLSNAEVTSGGLIKSPVTNKIIVLIIMTVISLFFLYLSFVYFKKTIKYYKEKTVFEGEEETDDIEESRIMQRTCPKCGISHDIDYPKCPNCKHNYLE